jgi:hypothetical protein
MASTEILSYCGLVCSICPIYLAGREQDKQKRTVLIAEIINACKEFYGIDYKEEDITPCDGCTTIGGNIFSGCVNCKIKVCCFAKELQNCAYCNEYPCANLMETFKNEENAKLRLDQVRSHL